MISALLRQSSTNNRSFGRAVYQTLMDLKSLEVDAWIPPSQQSKHSSGRHNRSISFSQTCKRTTTCKKVSYASDKVKSEKITHLHTQTLKQQQHHFVSFFSFKLSWGMIRGAAVWHTHKHTQRDTHCTAAHRALLLKWSKLPGVKERLLLKKDREQRGREKEGEALRVEEFSEGKAEGDALTVGSRSDLERSAAVCVCVSLYSTTAPDSGKVHALCGQV